MLVYLAALMGAGAMGASYIGTSEDDTVHGTEGDDTINPIGGDDIVYGLGGDDFLAGDDGDDTLIGGAGIDTMYGGDGDDLLSDAEGANSWMYGGDGADRLISSGPGQGSQLSGDAGNDLLVVEQGRFFDMQGGAGDDVLLAEGVYGTMTGGEGADVFVPGTDPNGGEYPYPTLATVTDFDPAEDTMVVRLSGTALPEDFWLTEDSTGTLSLMTNQLEGVTTSFDITVARFEGLSAGDLTTADLVFLNEAQIDALAESQGPDGPVLPDDGDDTTDGGDDSAPTLTGTAGDDVLFGSFEGEVIDGLEGNDKLIGDDGNDTLIGGLGDDTYYAGDGHDVVRDTADGINGGRNEVYGNGGNDILEVAHGRFSELFGGEGDDILISDQTVTQMTGGEGADYFLPADTPNGIIPRLTYAIIQDFTPGEDKVVIRLFGDETEDDFAVVARDNGDVAIERTLTPIITETVAILNGVSLSDISDDDIVYVSDAQADAFVASQGAGGPDASLLTGGDDGGGGDDGALTGTEGDDRIIGTFDDDTILGFGGDDFIVGDDGSDTIDADDGRDTVYGGDGNNLIRAEGPENEPFGNDGDDILWSTEGAMLTGGAGADYFAAQDGTTVITDFEPGTDRIVIPLATGQSPDDYEIRSTTDPDGAAIWLNDVRIADVPGASSDQLAAAGTIVFLETPQFEAFLNSQGADGPTLPAPPAPTGPTEGPDSLIGTDSSDTINGLGGDDTIDGLAGDDRLDGGGGNDLLFAGEDTETGDYSREILQVLGDDRLFGGDGDDTIVGDVRNLSAFGGAGNDLIIGGEDGVQRLSGGAGDDTLVGGDAISDGGLYSPTGLSFLNGGSGADVLVDGVGFSLVGGLGTDTFVADGYTRISDFSPSQDGLLLPYVGDAAPDSFEVSVLNQTKFYRLTHLGYDLRVTVTATDGWNQSWTVLLVDDGVQLGPNPMNDFPGTQQQIDDWTSRVAFVSAAQIDSLTAGIGQTAPSAVLPGV